MLHHPRDNLGEPDYHCILTNFYNCVICIADSKKYIATLHYNIQYTQ